MYMARTRPYTQSVHGRERPCTRAVNKAVYRVPDRVGVPCTWPWTHHVHGPCTPVYTIRTCRERPSLRPVCTALYVPYTGPCMVRPIARTRPCTRSCTLYTAVFTARVRGRVPCTCTCLWSVYTAVHVQTVYGPCTWSVHEPNAAVSRTRPCLRPVPCTRPFTACTDRVHLDTVHSRHRKKLTTETCWTAITQIQ